MCVVVFVCFSFLGFFIIIIFFFLFFFLVSGFYYCLFFFFIFFIQLIAWPVSYTSACESCAG